MSEQKYAYWPFKYIWILVIVPKVVCSLFIFAYGMLLLLNLKRVKLDTFIQMIIGFLSIYFISVLVRIWVTQSVASVPATINTMLMWVFGIVFYLYFTQNPLDYNKICSYCFRNLGVLIAFSLLFLLKNHIQIIGNISLFGNKLFNEPSWTNEGFKYRLFAFMEFPTNVATFYFINAGGALAYVFRKFHNALIRVSYAGLIMLPVYLSDTRSGIVAALFVLMIVVLLSIENVNLRRMFIILVVIALIPMLLVFAGKLEAGFVSMLDSRQGSSDTRIRLYVTTLNKVFTESPFIGMGIKYPNPFVYGLPYGSHSTYVGLIYRTGIVGAFVALLAFLRITKESLRISFQGSIHRFLGIVMIGYFVAIIFLDIDASAWVLAMFFINTALIHRYGLQLKGTDNL
jgi:hypothetical protein